MTTPKPEVLRLAGCVVWRITPSGRVKLLLARSRKNGDWLFPKGRRDDGETDLECAVREVLEESGAQGEIGPELSTIEYEDSAGQPKSIRYWAMHYESGEFVVNSETDEISWVKLSRVEDKLAHDRYAVLVNDLRNHICTPE